jgi:hypothetical protein
MVSRVVAHPASTVRTSAMASTIQGARSAEFAHIRRIQSPNFHMKGVALN